MTYYEKNKEKIRAYQKEYHNKNKKAQQLRGVKFRAENKENLAAYHKVYYQENKERLQEYQKEYHKNYNYD